MMTFTIALDFQSGPSALSSVAQAEPNRAHYTPYTIHYTVYTMPHSLYILGLKGSNNKKGPSASVLGTCIP